MANKIYTSYTLLGALFIASSCAQEAPERGGNHHQGVRIEFLASLPELVSRATELNNSSLSEFQVSAFTVGNSSETVYFTDKIFKRDRTGVFLCLDEECIWPNISDSLRFVAFYPTVADMHAADGRLPSVADKLNDFKVARDIASQFDFVTSIAGGSLDHNEESGVSLNMQHQLSRIFLKAWGNSQSFDLEIAGVRIGGVGTEASFSLAAGAGTPEGLQGGVWQDVSNGYVEYIFRAGDTIVKLDGSDATPNSADKAVSILGAKVGGESGYENSAMLIPTDNPAWDYKGDASNGEGNQAGKYISVLIRVTDDTPYDTNGSLVYPFEDETREGKTIWMAIDDTDGKTVKTRLYRAGEEYFTDMECTQKYDLEGNGAVAKDFAWAALPVQEVFKPGLVYTYTLNYSNGVGLRAPDDSDPGASILSDRVLLNVEVAEWKTGADSSVTVPRR